MPDFYLFSVIAFFAVLAILIYRDRKKIQISYYLLYMRRTKRFRDAIDSVAKSFPRFWKIFGTIGVIASFAAMVFGIYLLSQSASLSLSGKIKEPAIGFVFPIPSSQPASVPGIIGIPFWFWIISVAIILIPHEFMHGVISRMEKVRLKSVGLLLLAIFPGAFVEPDEKQLARKGLWARLRVFAAGSFINILIGLSVLLIAQSFWSNGVQPGLLITSVAENSPADLAGLKAGMVIQDFDGTPRLDFNDYSAIILLSKFPNSTSEKAPQIMGQLLLINRLSSHNPGDNVSITAFGNEKPSKNIYNIGLGKNPNNPEFPYLGVSTSLNTTGFENFAVLFPLLAFIWMLSVFVGVFNILPIYPLDGGLMMEAVAKKYAKRKSKRIVRAITLLTLFIILLNFAGPYVAKIL